MRQKRCATEADFFQLNKDDDNEDNNNNNNNNKNLIKH